MDYNEDLKAAINTLREGGIILYPTDTIWGLGCDATNSQAVAKIFQIKNRAESKSLIVLVNGVVMLERYVREIPEAALNILEVSDTPVTIIYPQGKNLAEGVCNEDGSVGIRICQDDFCNELITRFRKPVVSTSANLSGTTAPENFADIDEAVLKLAGYAVKHRQDDPRRSSPSPIIKIEVNGVIKIIRK